MLVDDPAADLHDWYGRYLYFAPDELEPLGATAAGPDTERGDTVMRSIGITTTALAAPRPPQRSWSPCSPIPDVKRYLKIRSMSTASEEDAMSDSPSEHLSEEPQAERGAPGSRDEGPPEPGGGPVDRPAGTSDADSRHGHRPAGPQHPDAPTCRPATSAG